MTGPAIPYYRSHACARHVRNANGDDGFALLIILWTIAILALILSQVLSSGRTELRLASNARTSAVLQAAADGAVEIAIFHLAAKGDAQWHPDHTIHHTMVAGFHTDIEISNEADKINPNSAPVELLQALLDAVGVDKQTASHLAVAIAGWHTSPVAGETRHQSANGYSPTGAPFQALEDLLPVPGMTQDIFQHLMPHLTLIHEGDPDANSADPLVSTVLSKVSGRRAPLVGSRDETAVMIRVSIFGPDRARAGRQAGVRIGGNARGGPAQILTWEPL